MKKKLHRRCLTGLKVGAWLRVWNIELTLVPSLKIKPRKHSAGKYMWHRFWKNKRSWWDSKQNECLCGSSRPKGSLKIVLGEISQNSQEIYAGISFFIKLLTLYICCFIKNKSLAQMFSCEFCEICKNTFFANTTGRLLLIIAVSMVMKRELANETVNYDTKLKHMYQFEPEV